jgi:hypothetical protein
MPTPDQRQGQQGNDRCAPSAGEPFDQLCDNFFPSGPRSGIVFQKFGEPGSHLARRDRFWARRYHALTLEAGRTRRKSGETKKSN